MSRRLTFLSRLLRNVGMTHLQAIRASHLDGCSRSASGDNSATQTGVNAVKTILTPRSSSVTAHSEQHMATAPSTARRARRLHLDACFAQLRHSHLLASSNRRLSRPCRPRAPCGRAFSMLTVCNESHAFAETRLWPLGSFAGGCVSLPCSRARPARAVMIASRAKMMTKTGVPCRPSAMP